MMRRWWAVLAAVAVMVQSGRGDTIWFRNGDPPRHGRIVGVDDATIRIEPWPAAGDPVFVFDRSEVAGWRRTIDDERLGRLDPRHPELYLELAESLAGESYDPSARTLAVELSLIALECGTSDKSRRELARSAWLLLLQLLENPGELSRAQVLGRELGFAPMVRPVDVAGSGSGPQGEVDVDRGAILEWLRLVRGDSPDVPAAPAGMDRWLSSLGRHESAEELRSWTSREGLAPDRLLAILELEAIARGEELPGVSMDLSWAAQARGPAVMVAGPQQPRDITGFDPRYRWWRDGRWQLEPEAGGRRCP